MVIHEDRTDANRLAFANAAGDLVLTKETSTKFYIDWVVGDVAGEVSVDNDSVRANVVTHVDGEWASIIMNSSDFAMLAVHLGYITPAVNVSTLLEFAKVNVESSVCRLVDVVTELRISMLGL